MGMQEKISYKIVIIGGGASGMAAAIAALKENRKLAGKVILLESNERVGKKILATGNGKCNFTHENISTDAYHTDDQEVLERILTEFPTEAALQFFERLGMLFKNKSGYYYPLTETASTVLDVLRLRMEELGCEVKCNIKVEQLEQKADGRYLIKYYVRDEAAFQDGVKSSEKDKRNGNRKSCRDIRNCIHTDCVILATGSKAGGFLQDREENPLRLAGSLGLQITPLYPALAKCICQESFDQKSFYKGLAGVRAQAELSLYEETGSKACPEKNGGDRHSRRKLLRKERGELQLTKEGISGIVVFQLSGDIAEKLAEKKRIVVEINFLPDFPENDLEDWTGRRLIAFPKRSLEDFFLGVLHKKVLYACLQREGLKPSGDFLKAYPDDLEKETSSINKIMRVMKRAMHFTTEVTNVSDMKQAQVCRGGICLSQFNEQLECKILSGLFCCGEVLNVDGLCGGYNLHFAWASGYLAGKGAAKFCCKG